MKKPFSNILPLGFVVLLGASPLCAQTERFVTAAKLDTAVGAWSTVFFNGKQLIDRDPLTYSGSDPNHVEHEFTPDELCLFGTKNALAFELTLTIEKLDGPTAALLHTLGDKIGVAYVLTIMFSDNTTAVFTSSETGKALSYYSVTQPKVAGWAAQDFNDSSWAPAGLVPPSPITTFKLPDPVTRSPALFLVAWKNDELITQHTGEVWKFRRDFPLTVGIRPGCQAIRVKKPTATPTPAKLPPTATPTHTAIPPKPTATPKPTNTPIPTKTPIPPKPTATPRPTNTPIPLKPTATPKIPPKATPLPTATPRPIIQVDKPTPIPIATKKVVEIPPTPTLPPVQHKTIEEPPTLTPTETPIPLVKHNKPTATMVVATATFTAIPTDTPEPDAPITITEPPPVNIDANFADGPGQYKVEIVDEGGNHLITLFDKQLTYRKETWVSWEGKNDQGTSMGPGHYFAIFTKDGNVMRKIALNWIAPNP